MVRLVVVSAIKGNEMCIAANRFSSKGAERCEKGVESFRRKRRAEIFAFAWSGFVGSGSCLVWE